MVCFKENIRRYQRVLRLCLFALVLLLCRDNYLCLSNAQIRVTENLKGNYIKTRRLKSYICVIKKRDPTSHFPACNFLLTPSTWWKERNVKTRAHLQVPKTPYQKSTAWWHQMVMLRFSDIYWEGGSTFFKTEMEQGTPVIFCIKIIVAH